jgi:hypothetical protein
MRPHRILLAGTAAGAFVLVSATTAAFAAPAPNHGHGHGHGHTPSHPAGRGHGNGHVHKTADKLTGPRHAAQQVVTAQSARLKRSLASVTSAATPLNATDQAALATALQAELDALAADAAAIPGASSVAQLNAIKHAAVGTVAVAGTQVGITLAADAVEARVATDTSTLSDLTAQVATAEQNGTDVTAAQAALDDAQTQLATANSDATAAVSGILALSPTASKADLLQAADAAELELTNAHIALDATDSDIATVNTALGN